MTRFSQTNSGIRPERHARTAQTDDRRDDVDRRADAAESRDEQAERPVVGAVARREGLRGQRRVGEPADVGRVAAPYSPFAPSTLK